MLPAPIGWGSERRGNAAGALSPRGAARQSPHCRALPQSLGLACCGAGLALRRIETPRAFHGFNQQPGDRPPRLDRGTNYSKDAAIEGSRRPFDLREPLHPCAKRMTGSPVPGPSPSCRLAMCSS